MTAGRVINFDDILEQEEAGQSLKRNKERPDARAEIKAVLGKAILPCKELAALGIPPRELLLGNWFLEGDLGFIFAPRGIGKTWLALAIATAIAGGGKCGPWTASGACRVLCIDGEMPCESLCERIEGMNGDENLSVLNHEALFHLKAKTLNLADPVTQEVLTGILIETRVKVLLLDNLSCLFSGVKENDADDWEVVLRWFLTLRRHRIAVVLIHHSGRNKETMRGTSRREDAAFWVSERCFLLRASAIHQHRWKVSDKVTSCYKREQLLVNRLPVSIEVDCSDVNRVRFVDIGR